MFIMIFVNDFWKVHDVPHWLEHAVYGEDFMGLADIVFPCFLFAVGMSIPYAIERRYAKGFSAESRAECNATAAGKLDRIGEQVASDAQYALLIASQHFCRLVVSHEFDSFGFSQRGELRFQHSCY